ncbi:MAG: DUF1501 domain-containing protein [Verrucomicrobiaceae bacterium]|nr:DUF1501 domain-containing protein [Verrucomicrobiaceae bacterium]
MPRPSPKTVKPSPSSVWLWGGPCRIDTFDPKPEAGREFTGALDQTLRRMSVAFASVSGSPQARKCADKYSLIRSMIRRQ